MIELRITGDNVTDFYTNAASALALVARGGMALHTPPAETNVPDKPSEIAESVAEPNPSVLADVTGPKKRTRAPKVVDAEPAKPLADANLADLTADDMRDRVRAILAAHKDRGHPMPTCIEYVKQLFAPFDVKLAAEVPPERRAEFMKASEPYLDGTA